MEKYSNFPDELKKFPQWVLHKNKLPFNPVTLKPAKPNDPSTWGTFEKAVSACDNSFSGIGFAFAENKHIVGIDLDHVINKDTGKWENGCDWAKIVVETVNSYTEISPSGTGLHIYAYADVNIKKHKKTMPNNSVLEIYNSGRYFTVTGNKFHGCKVEQRTDEVQIIYDCYFFEPEKPKQEPQRDKTPIVNNQDYLQIGLEKDSLFNSMWHGFRASSDESRNDASFMIKLAYWCNRNTQSMVNAFLASPYVSGKDEKHFKKANRKDYAQRTAENTVKWLDEQGNNRTAAADNEDYQNSIKSFDELSKTHEIYYKQAESKEKSKNNELASLDDFFKSGYGLTDLTDKDYEPPKFFIDNLISIGLTAIVGASKVGKSTYTTQMCNEVACGGCFLGHKAHKTGVVYFDLEESKGLVANRTLKQGYSDISQGDLLIFHELPSGYELNKKFLQLIDTIRTKNPHYELFVVDTIARAMCAEKSNGNNAYMADVEIYKEIQKYAIENNIAIILITHDGKASDNTRDVTKKQNGSTGLPATADTTIFISRKGDDRTSDEGTYELTGRLFASAKGIMIFDKSQLKWKSKTEVKDYLTRDPYISHILQIAPENVGGAVTVTYKKIFEDVTHFTYNPENRTSVNNIKSIIESNLDELYLKHKIAVSVGARTNDGRGIKITRC